MIKYCDIHNADELIKLCGIIINPVPETDSIGNIIGFPIIIATMKRINETGLYSKTSNRFVIDDDKIIEIDIENYTKYKNHRWFDKQLINNLFNTENQCQ